MSEKKMIQAFALWKKTKNDGEIFLVGKLNQRINIVIFKNGFKTEDKHPDYVAYFSEVEQQERPKGDNSTIGVENGGL